MRIILATTFVPFVGGGADLMVDSLEVMLRRCGHEVEVFRFPFIPDWRQMLDQMLALRLFDLSGRGDRLIAVRTPSYLLRHPNKVLWFIHHHRSAYDLWGTQYSDMPDTAESACCRDAFRKADGLAFREARRVFTNSQIVARRLKSFNDVESEVLYPPILDPERFRSGSYGDYVLYVSRIVPHKRQHLAVEALRHTRTPVRLVIAGPCNSEEYLEQLRAVAVEHGIADRVTVVAQWISEDEKTELIADCLAGIYTPFEEDSYGYAGLELQHALKAIITTTDSGGPLELIRDGVNGLICEPEPKALAEAMDRLYRDRKEARRLGEAAAQRISALGITWENVLNSLLS
jgi:glycosyltransferase involved in cell wall biosynthesis